MLPFVKELITKQTVDQTEVNLKKKLRSRLNTLSSTLDVDSAVIVLQNGARYKHVASRNAEMKVIEKTIRLSQHHTEHSYSDSASSAKKKQILTLEIATDRVEKQRLIATPLITSFGRFIGFLSIGCKFERSFAEFEKSYLRLLADHIPTLLSNYVYSFNQKLSWEGKSKFTLLLEKLADNLSTAIWVRDENGVYLFTNETYKKLLGLGGKKLMGATAHQVLDKEVADKVRSNDKKVFSSGRMIVLNDDYTIDGNLRHFKTHMFPLDGIDDGLPNAVGGVSMDVTNLKKSRQKVVESLKEKETLLMEIHHRVKNNLALVSSMMQLQAMKTQDEALEKKLYDFTNRIKTMAIIHELLYQSPSFSKLRYDDIIRKLTRSVLSMFHRSCELDCNFDLESVKLNINQAVPCSLILNEVITNVGKHAFEGRSEGRVFVQLNEQNDKITLLVRDNGNGLPDDFEGVGCEDSMGLELIETLVCQVRGDFEYISTEIGTEFKLTFKKADIKGSSSHYI